MMKTEEMRPKLFDLIRERSFGRGKVMLASGRESDFYFDMKPTMLHPFGAAALAALSLGELQSVTVDSVGGLELGAVPIAVAIVQASHATENPLSAFIVRKKTKEHGAKKLIEGLAKGESIAGRNVAVLEDVTTTGGSALQAVEVLREAGAHIALILTMVDRQEGAEAAFHQAKLPFRALFKAEEFLK